MKHLLLLLPALALLSTAATAQTRRDMTIIVDSVPREFVVSKPSGAAPAGGYPIVVMFHGSSGNGPLFYNISGWKEKGEEEKFITLFPSSLEYCIDEDGRRHRTTKWNTGALEITGCEGQVFKDDVQFVRSMLDTIQKVFPIDRRRIYASGFSNGGVFTSKLAVEMSDVFASLTAAAGALNPGDSGAPKRNLPFVYSVGNRDQNVLEKIGLTEIPFNDSAFAILTPIINIYLPLFNLTSDYTKTQNGQTITWRFNTPASASAPASEFRVSLIKDATHQYPNGTNHPVVAANAFWQFFQQFSLASRVGASSADNGTMKVYPNPARTDVTVEGKGGARIILWDLLGRSVLEQEIDGRTTIPLHGVASGLYVIEMQTPAGVTMGKLRVE